MNPHYHPHYLLGMQHRHREISRGGGGLGQEIGLYIDTVPDLKPDSFELSLHVTKKLEACPGQVKIAHRHPCPQNPSPINEADPHFFSRPLY